MRGVLYAALAGAAFLALPVEAEAARCKSGMIYRPSLGICQAKANAPVRYAKASTRHRYKRAKPVKPVKQARVMQAATEAPPLVTRYAPAMNSPRTPMWDTGAAPERIIQPRPQWLEGVDVFDSLHAQAWFAAAARN